MGDMKKVVPVSALGAVYYGERAEYFSAALESLYNQTVEIDQIVIVQDGPIPLDLQQVIDYWTGKLNIDVRTLPENLGLASALNFGLQFCRNDIVARFDTDDLNVASRVELQYKFFLDNPGLAVLGGGIEEFIYEAGDITATRNVPLLRKQIERELCWRNPFNHMTVMYSKAVVEGLGGYCEHPFMEDYNLWIRLIGAGFDARNLNKTLVYARVGNGMISRRRGWRYVKSEYALARLKVGEGVGHVAIVWFVFMTRSFARVLPTFFLKYIYLIFARN